MRRKQRLTFKYTKKSRFSGKLRFPNQGKLRVGGTEYLLAHQLVSWRRRRSDGDDDDDDDDDDVDDDGDDDDVDESLMVVVVMMIFRNC